MILPPVLVVEDDPDILQALRFVLEDEGYSVYEAPDGAAGLARLLLMPDPTIVLLGIMMPVMDGREMLHIVAADSTLATRHRYIVVTGLHFGDTHEDRDLLTRLDTPVILKPFTQRDILDAVEQARVKLS